VDEGELMATLLSLASQTYTPQTVNLGPFNVVSFRGLFVQSILQATSWPASGTVFSISVTYDDGNGGSATFFGGTIPNSKGQFPTAATGIPFTASTASVQIFVTQTFTTPIVVTAQ
jgi:hypothetical protein